MRRLKAEIDLPLNFEMAATAEMIALACEIRPHAACLVPERRAERTTEGGLDVAGQGAALAPAIAALAAAGVRVSLFIDPEIAQVEAARALGAPVVELHTGAYQRACASSDPKAIAHELSLLAAAARAGAALGLEIHAGHGLDFHNVQPVAAMPEIAELNIGHFLVGEAVFMGLGEAVREMKRLMADARTGALY
jgi:pyridoxine 5-phosphate synthase